MDKRKSIQNLSLIKLRKKKYDDKKKYSILIAHSSPYIPIYPPYFKLFYVSFLTLLRKKPKNPNKL